MSSIINTLTGEQPQTMEYIRVIDGHWTVNGKRFHECTMDEKRLIWEKSLWL